MILFYDLPAHARAIFTFLAFFMCGFGMITFCYASLIQRWNYFIGGFLCSTIGFFFIQTAYDISLWHINGTGSIYAYSLGQVPYIIPYSLIIIGTAASTALLLTELLRRKHIITYTSVKEAINKLPSALMYYYDSGRVLFINKKMRELGPEITGRAVVNANDIYNALNEDKQFISEDSSVYFFFRNKVLYDNHEVYELIAYNVTDLYEKQQRIRKNNERIRELNKRLKEYNLSLAASIREKEILDTKINIHDETNRLILATHNAIAGDTGDEEKLKLLKTWQQNVLMLCKEAGMSEENDVLNDLNSLAGTIGIALNMEGELTTEDSEILEYFTLASKEAMINAIKHGEAKNLYIKLTEDEKSVILTYTNDGLLPKKKIKAVGGLKNLKTRLAERGGSVTYTADPEFKLTVTIPKEADNV